MSHQFFEPEMGLATPPAHFQQKGQKRPPWVSITALASLVRKDEPRGGESLPSETLLHDEKKKSSVGHFSHGRKRHFFLAKSYGC